MRHLLNSAASRLGLLIGSGNDFLGFVNAFVASIIHGNGYNMAQRDIFGALAERGVTIQPETGAISLSDELLRTFAPPAAPVPDTYPQTTTFSDDMSGFRDPPVSPAAPALAPAPLDDQMDMPMSRREVVALVQRLQPAQYAPAYTQAPPPTVPTFRSEAVLNVLEAQIRDAWKRRGRS